MFRWLLKRTWLSTLLCGASLTVLQPALSRAGDDVLQVTDCSQPRPPCPALPGSGGIAPVPSAPSVPSVPSGDPMSPPAALDQGLEAREASQGARLGDDIPVGNYIDFAVPQTQFRLRFDSMYDSNRPNRGEYFYPKPGFFRIDGTDPTAAGPPLRETNIDSTQELHAYLEYATSDRFSVFAEVPFRFINPEVNSNESGLSDVSAGFKFAVIAQEDRTVTTQLRLYADTGDGDKGLGTEHYTIEASLLFNEQLSDRTYLFGKVCDWIPLDGSDFAGNVLLYGLGVNYVLSESCSFRVVPTAEILGWTFLSGKEFVPGAGVQDASGDTIINAHLGIRFGIGDRGDGGLLNRSEFAISYGRALTGEVIYKDLIRAEIRFPF
jgi:hypothetical protein